VDGRNTAHAQHLRCDRYDVFQVVAQDADRVTDASAHPSYEAENNQPDSDQSKEDEQVEEHFHRRTPGS
jgi:hypothetical protein